MRRISRELKSVLVVGCGWDRRLPRRLRILQLGRFNAPSSLQPGAGKALNPSGKPADPAYASAMEKQGEAMNAARDQQAQAMAAAKAKAGAH
jgi:hypothetical protein